MKAKTTKYPAKPAKSALLNDAAVLDTPHPLLINVRAAKDSLSSLLEKAAQGLEIIITSDGEPKAKLVPVHTKRKAFRVDRELLRSIPLRKGPSAEEIVRADRDGGF